MFLPSFYKKIIIHCFGRTQWKLIEFSIIQWKGKKNSSINTHWNICQNKQANKRKLKNEAGIKPENIKNVCLFAWFSTFGGTYTNTLKIWMSCLAWSCF